MENWVHKKLEDCLTIGNGCDYKHLKPGDVPVYGTGGVMTYVDRYLYDGETVCIGRKGTINHPVYHNGKIWTVDTLFYTHSFIDVLPLFIYYVFCNEDWNKYNEATGVPSLSKETIYKIEIPIPFKNNKPDLSAQRRIAAILSSADKVIASVQKLIAKYKQIKQGLMEELLKPKEGWKKVRLGECLTIGNGQDYKHLQSGEIPVYGTGGVMTYVDDYLYEGETVCIGRKGTINKPIFHVGKIWTVDTLFYTHSFIDVSPLFIYYVFCNIDWNKYNEATGIPSLSKETIYKIEIAVPFKNDKPDLTEQRRIASILSGIDAKIAAEEKVLEKYEKVKRGLMERLLEEMIRRL